MTKENKLKINYYYDISNKSTLNMWLKYSYITLVFITLISFTCQGQTSGDYRSAATGNWTTPTTWERYNGSTWVTPTVAQGYPGQYSGTGAVTIKAGHTVTIGVSGIATQPIGSLKIENTAQLYLTGANSTVTFTINTSDIIINSGGSIYFFNKSKLVLSADATVRISATTGSIIGDCNNNNEIWIGTVKFAACSGAPGNLFTFTQIMQMGGTLNAIPSSNSPLCQGNTINLTGSYSGAIGTTPTYSWTITAPGGAVTNYTTQNVSIPSAVTGTYVAKLTVTTVLSGTTYTNNETINIVVNPLPTLTGASQNATLCDGSSVQINLSGLVPNTTFTINYSINGVAQTAVSGLTSNASGTSSFTTSVLTYANNGQTLQITGITITNPTTNCQKTFSQNVTISVFKTGTWIGTTSSDWNTASNWCGGVPSSTTDVIILSTATNQPIIGAGGMTCRNITINSGATLTISGSNSINVSGNWVNNGTFVPNSSTVTFNGTTAISGSSTNSFNNVTIASSSTLTAPSGNMNIAGNFTNDGTFNNNNGTITFNGTGAQSIKSGGNSFYNFTITNTGGTCTASTNAITVTNNFTTNAGTTLDMGTNALSVNTVSNSGTLLTQNTSSTPITSGKIWGGTVTYNGASAQTAMAGTYNNLTISTTGGATASGDITVNGVLNLAGANASATKGCLEMVTNYNNYPRTNTPNQYDALSSYTLTMGSNATTIGQGDVTGKIYRNSLLANTVYTFGNQYTSYAFTVAPTDVTVFVTIGTAYGDGATWGNTSAVQRSYEMIPTGGAGGRVSMNLHYLESELNGNSESQLTTGDYDIDQDGGTLDGAPLGDEHGRSSYDYTNNYIGLSGVPIDYFQPAPTHNWRTIFNLHNYSSDRMVWTGDNGSNQWYTEGSWYNVTTNQKVGIPGSSSIIVIPDVTNDPIVPADLTLGGVEILSGGNLDLNGKTITLNASNYNGWEDQSGLSNYSGSTVIIDASTTGYSTPVLGIPHFNNLTINPGASMTIHSNSHVYISGVLTKNGDFDASTNENTVDYNGAAQTIVLPDGNKYYHLTLSGSGTKNLPALTAIVGNLTISGTVSTGTSSAQAIGGNVTISNGTTFTAGSYTHTVGGDWTNSGTFTATGSTIEFNGTGSGNISASNFNNIAFSGAGTKTATGILSISGNVNISNNFTAGAYTHTVNGNWTNTGTFTATGSTIDFNATSGSQTIGASNFNNITLSGAGSKTATGILSIAGNVAINSNFTAGAYTHTVGGDWTKSGTFDATGSTINFNGAGSGNISASNFNNIAFSGAGTKTATGILSITGNVDISNNFTAGAYTHTVSGNWTNTGIFTATGSTINFNGAGSGNIGTSNFNNITLSGAGSKTATGALSIAGNVDISNNFTAGAYTHTVGGNWTKSGTFTSTGSTIEFNGTNSGSISASNFNNIAFSGAGTKTATGILSITGNVDISNNFTAGAYTHTVGGNWTKTGTFTATGSTIDFSGTSTGNIGSSNFNNITLSGAGSKTASGALSIAGNVDISNNFTAGAFTHTVGGNWTKTGTFTATGSTIDFNASSGSQTIGASNFNDISFTGAGTKSAIGNLTITGDVAINSNFTLGNYNHAVGGDYINYGTFTAASCGSGSISFNGTTFQTIISGGSKFGDVIFNNTTTGPADIYVNDPMIISCSATFTNGEVLVSGNGSFTFENGSSANSSSANSFIDGPVTKIGNAAFTFPIGESVYYAPIAISAADGGGNITDYFTAHYIHENPNQNYNIDLHEVSIDHVSKNEYWTLERNGTTNNVSVTLSWDTRSGSITDFSKLVVAHWNGTLWKNEGNTATTGDNSAGTVTSNLVSTFSPFTLASTDASNPLPISLISFDGTCDDATASILLNWICASETNNDYFTVERYSNQKSWEEITKIKGAGSTSSITNYSFYDELNGIPNETNVLYYRLKQTDYNEKSKYFNTISVQRCSNINSLYISPNPCKNDISITYHALKEQMTSISISDITGKKIYECSVVSYKGTNNQKINLLFLPAGVYIITLDDGYKQLQSKIIKN